MRVIPLFRMGNIVATPGAIQTLLLAGQTAGSFLARHVNGDWGEVSADDAQRNTLALAQDERVLSAYRTRHGDRIWIITEADRSATTILLPEEY